MIFHDAHCHQVLAQAGGLLIALEGCPVFPGVVTNEEALAREDPGRLLFGVEYVTREAVLGTRPFLKYHPRREGYSPEFVSDSIRRSSPNLCIIDTLNQPYWQPMDYWRIAREFPSLPFVFCHAGGYDILDLLKMADFTPNIWLDFSLTQEYFGWSGQRPRLAPVADCIDHALQAPQFRQRILFGSDEPFYSQSAALERYLALPDPECFLVGNFLSLLRAAGIR